jgi:hypothetical protein
MSDWPAITHRVHLVRARQTSIEQGRPAASQVLYRTLRGRANDNERSARVRGVRTIVRLQSADRRRSVLPFHSPFALASTTVPNRFSSRQRSSSAWPPPSRSLDYVIVAVQCRPGRTIRQRSLLPLWCGVMCLVAAQVRGLRRVRARLGSNSSRVERTRPCCHPVPARTAPSSRRTSCAAA